MRDAGPRYVPALGRPALTRFYDTVLALTMRERLWRPLLRDRIAQHVGNCGRIVDVGAGTGTLAIALATLRPDAQVIAVDGDPEVLRLARRKPGAERVSWRRGLAGGLDLEDGSAEAIVMSLLLHHLDPGFKRRALLDARRVLADGARLHVAGLGQAARSRDARRVLDRAAQRRHRRHTRPRRRPPPRV
ncbi:MAG TPA: methyltransferase domain-containing protein, partial [Ilumatobacter sp.]